MDKKYYNLVKLKMHLIENSIIKKEHLEEFSISNLFKSINLNKVNFTFDENVLFVLDEEQFNKFSNYFFNKYNIDINNNSYSNKIITNSNIPVKSNYITDIEDLKLFRIQCQKNPKYQKKLEIQNIEKLNKNKDQEKLSDVKNIDFKDHSLSFISIDFEFQPDVLNKFHFQHTTEVGVTILKNNKYESYHFIVEENSNQKEGKKRELQASFNFGNSEYISYKDLKNRLQDLINDKDYIVLHEHSNDLRILKQNEIKYSPDKVKDTQYIYSKHFRKEGEEQFKSLKKLLDDHNIISKNLHNAGNDSRYTLMLFKTLVNDLKNLSKKNQLHI